MAVLSVYTDASFSKISRLTKIGYSMYKEGIKIYDFFSDNLILPEPYDNNDAEVLAVIHVLDKINNSLSNLNYLNVHHIAIHTDNKNVVPIMQKYSLEDYIINLSRKNITVHIKHLSRNNPRIKYVDYNLRFN